MAKRKNKRNKKNKITGKTKKKQTKKLAFLLSAISCLTIITTIILLYSFSRPQQVERYKMSLIVNDHSGFDLNRTAITFGMVMPSDSSMRHLDIKNSEYRNKVIIRVTGELAKWIRVSNNSFILEPNEVKFLDIVATAPPGCKYGNYTGTLIINLLRR